MTLWSASFFAILAVFVALKLGYFQVERTPITWILSAMASIVIPVVALLPLYNSLRSIQQKQFGWLRMTGNCLDRAMIDATDALQHGRYADVERIMGAMKEIRALHEAVTAANLWPFNTKALAFISVVTTVQLVLTAQKLFELIKGG
jgi:hypothetical protein